jgi:hypothetical protein
MKVVEHDTPAQMKQRFEIGTGLGTVIGAYLVFETTRRRKKGEDDQ